MAARVINPYLDFGRGNMSTIFINSYLQSAWTPAQPTTSGGILPHTWEVPGVANFQDTAKTTPAGVGDVVGAVVNQGSDTHDIVQATTANKPTLQQVTINSVTSYVWRFDGTNDSLKGAFGGGAISQPFTVFAVAKLDATLVNDNTFRIWIDSDDTSNRMVLQKSSLATPDNWRIFGGAALSGGDADANWNIWTALFNGVSSQFWLSGVSEASGDAGAGTPDGITVGSAYNAAFFWKGDIGPILIYPGNLSTVDKNQVGGYLERVTGIAWTTIT